MKICTTIPEARAAARDARSGHHRLGLVPTMGALHAGHMALVTAARARCDSVAVSIFVNPTQFGPSEDLSRYPRQFERDSQLLQQQGVEILFAPSVEEMYPGHGETWVDVQALGARLDGRSRPGHFRGVATIVAKLLNIIGPDLAFFGQKDAAQLAIIRRMVLDLNFSVQIVACPILRENDGLAMSSRNVYLTADERIRALALHRSLRVVEGAFAAGERGASRLIALAKEDLAREPHVRLDYFEIVDPVSLEAVDTISEEALAAVAAYIGSTRLIDNVLLSTVAANDL